MSAAQLGLRPAAVRPLPLYALVLLVAMVAACGSDNQTTADFDAAADVSAPDVEPDVDPDAGDGADEVLDPPDTGPDTTPDTTPDAELDVDPDGSGDNVPAILVDVDTVLSAVEVTAGTTVLVTCRGIDADGLTIDIPAEVTRTILLAPQDSITPGDGPGQFIPTRAGVASATCVLPQLGLIDDTPAEVIVKPGLVHTLVASLDRATMPAGEFAEVSCEGFDAYNNPIETFTWNVTTDPFGEGVEIDRTYVIATRAGTYDVRCDAAGAAVTVPALLEVAPGLPASVSLGVSPTRSVYRIGEVVELRYTVVDAYGNPIDNAPVSFASLPTVPRFSEGRFRFNNEGDFTLTVIVGLPTESGSPLTASVDVRVNSEGPTIECLRPFDGQFVNIPYNSDIVFRGRAADVFGTSRIEVNGIPATIEGDGTFEVTLPSRFGINFVSITAWDTEDNPNSRTCAYLASERFSAEGGFLGDTVTLALTQDAIDDRDRGDLDSFDDILVTVLNSRGLRDTLHNGLQAANPLYDQCVQRVCIFGCFCALSASVRHEDTEMRGPNDTTLTLVDNGLRAQANVRNARFRLRIGGTFSTQGWVTMERISVDLTFNMGLEGGRPRVTLRGINAVSVGRIDTDFSGLTGLIVDLIVDLFNGTIRNLVQGLVTDFIRDNFNEVLDGLVSGLNIDSIGQNTVLPRLDGSGDVRLAFGVQFSSLTSNTTRALFGIGTRFSGDIVHEGATLGAAIPAGNVRFEPGGTRTLGAGVSLALFNQVLHTLWRGGFFDATLSGDLIGGGAASDAVAIVRTNLPPVIVGRSSNEIALMLGAMRATVLIPGIIDAPLQVSLGGVVTSGVDLLPGDILRFRNLVVEQIVFSPETPIQPVQREALESFLRDLLQFVVDDTLNGALPALPIPDFAIPEDLVPFGLPRGGALGVREPVLFNNTSHFVVEGNFGIR